MNKWKLVTFAFAFSLSTLFGEVSPRNPRSSLLLVIDMQKDILTPGKGGLKLDSVQIATLIQNVNRNITIAESLGIPVAYVKNEWSNPLIVFFSGNICKKGSPETAFDPRLKIIASAPVYLKSVPNSLSNQDLVNYIGQHQISTVYIAGMKSQACAGSTARNCLKRGLTTILLVPAIGSNSINTLKKNIVSLVKAGAKPADRIDLLPP
jgi:nicotinamidase-related amidase